MNKLNDFIFYFKFLSYISKHKKEYRSALRDAILALFVVFGFFIGMGSFLVGLFLLGFLMHGIGIFIPFTLSSIHAVLAFIFGGLLLRIGIFLLNQVHKEFNIKFFLERHPELKSDVEQFIEKHTQKEK